MLCIHFFERLTVFEKIEKFRYQFRVK